MKINNARDFTSVIGTAFRQSWEKVINEEGSRIATEFIDRVKQVIEGQEQEWTSLNPEYLAGKIRRGRDPRMLISSGEYKNSFQQMRIGARNGDVATWRVNPSGSRHPEADLTFAELGLLHEYGRPTQNLPPRPHWTPVLQEFEAKKGEIETGLLAKVVSEVRSRLKID